MVDTPPLANPQDVAGRRARVLVVDDEQPFRAAVSRTLRTEGYDAVEAEGERQAFEALDAHPADLILLDLKLDHSTLSGMGVLRAVIESHPHVPVIMISGKATVRTAVEATRLGAYDFLEKGVSRERLLLTVHNALEKARLERERDRLLEGVSRPYRMVGHSAGIHAVRRFVERAAETDFRVLITGESGVGKELVAGSIHFQSARASGPFVAVNCAAFPSEMIESELFGHEKAAFTGATERRLGKFEEADGGTLFLDEIGDMSLGMQAKVLRALQEREVTRVGGTGTIRVDVRVITATNKDLVEEIAARRFREDLYHRIDVLRVYVPPLRERQEDIPELARHLLRLELGERGLPPKTLTPEAQAELAGYDWPGNIRELRNLVKRLITFSDGSTVTAEEVRDARTVRDRAPAYRPVLGSVGAASTLPLKDDVDGYERRVLVQALVANGWNQTETAAALEIDRSTLHRKMKEHDIRVAKKSNARNEGSDV